MRNRPIGVQSRNQLAFVGQQYKLCSKDQGETWELFDILADPGEQHDLTSAEPNRVETMSRELKK